MQCPDRSKKKELPRDISLKAYVADVLSLTGTDINADDIDKCHPLGSNGDVIMSFSRREKRDAVLKGTKNL